MAKPELLAPVQDFTTLASAIQGGADAVYFGVQGFNMRANARNFTVSQLSKVVGICHKSNVKAYLALNVIIYDNELKKVINVLKAAKKAHIDAIICWDFSVMAESQKLQLPIHVSTQASIANYEAIKHLKQQYPLIERVVLARELSLSQISTIVKRINKDRLNVGIEIFVHGAMCVSVSGRCFMSHELFGKSANRGECLQPCRRAYKVTEQSGEYELELGTDEVLSPKDLCALPLLKRIIGSGVASLKIEGRNKSPEYVQVVTAAYREAIDNPKADTTSLLEKVKTVYNRGFSTGFFLGKPMDAWTKTEGSEATTTKVYIGRVLNFYPKPSVAHIILEAKPLAQGTTLMIQGPTTGVLECIASNIHHHEKAAVQAPKGATVTIRVPSKVRKNDKVYAVWKRK